jgi:hypothetical protein
VVFGTYNTTSKIDLQDENAALVVMFSTLGWVEAQWIVCLVGMAVLTLT